MTRPIRNGTGPGLTAGSNPRDHDHNHKREATMKAATEPQTEADLQAPLIHLNGTSKNDLVDLLCGASQALNQAYDTLRYTVPNGRDYYPLGPAAMQRAVTEHENRMRRLDAIKAEIDTLAEAISDQ